MGKSSVGHTKRKLHSKNVEEQSGGCAVAETSPSTAQPQDPSPDKVDVYAASYAGLLPLLQRLDQRLAAAVQTADQMFAARAAGDLYRGLAISPADVAAALGRVPGEPFLSLSIEAHEGRATTDSLSLRRLFWLQRMYGLTDVDLDVILIGLAPEIDLRYERLYAYLHDDVTRRRPSVDLALNLLCASAGEKLRQRDRFAPDAPLRRHRLIDLYTGPQHPNAPLLSHHYRLDEQIVRLLLLDDSVDSRLVAFCDMTARSGSNTPLTDAMRQQLHALAAAHKDSPLRMYFQGPAHCGQAAAATFLAETLDVRLLSADLCRLAAEAGSATNEVLYHLVREAWFRGALLSVCGIDAISDSTALGTLWRALKELPVHCVIEGKQAWLPTPDKPLGVVTVSFAYPEVAERRQWWQQCLRQHKWELDADSLTTVAQRYRMTFAQIQDAAAVAASSVGQPQAQTLFAAARAECGHDLSTLATKIESRATWDDLVLPEDETAQLHELCNRFIYRDKVLHEWGFAKKLSYGLGITALFSGGSGTGKTMAAEVIANALELDLYKIDLAQVVSKYIGETEKNLNKVFTAAANANAILFFDEADALFGKRSEVKDSHDRYANLEISYLLQKMEQYEGIAILATNVSDHLDQAFTRRLAFSIHFPFPDEAARLRLWERAWPQAVPVDESIDKTLLARELKLAGGNIKNIALGAAFNAAGNGEIVDLTHMSEAVRNEYQKIGKNLSREGIHCSAGESQRIASGER